MVLVDIETFLVWLSVVDTEGHERRDNRFDERFVDDFAVALAFDQTEHGASEFGAFVLDWEEEVCFPSAESELEEKQSQFPPRKRIESKNTQE